jgi:RNA polymerase sigma-70 factor (ECF subfamily)
MLQDVKPAAAPGRDDLLDRLQAGDDAEFARLLAAWSPAMLRAAAWYVGSREAAEDVVQDTWLAVLAGLSRFEGRSSLRTWVFAILANRARTHAVRERRTVPWSEVAGDDGPTVDPTRFQGPDDPYPGHWTSVGAPRPWWSQPEGASLTAEARVELRRAFAALPERQRAVVALRDADGLASDEVCLLLGISAQNQRVLLHRGRARLRTALEDYYRG